MMRDLKEAMMVSISEVLETMFYMPIELDGTTSLKESGILESGEMQVACLDFEGPVSGRLSLCIPKGLLQRMTADFMGEMDVSAAEMEGTLKEVANMVAGNTFSNLDDAAEFRLGIPEQIPVTALAAMTPPGEETFILVESVDGFMGIQMACT